jgi:uncharacterized protein
MRRKEREMKDGRTIRALLARSQVGRMATINRKGFPVIKPVNFLYWDDKIYVHSSVRGEKITDIRRGSLICFEVDDPIGYVGTQGPACKVSFYFRSIIIKGKAALLNRKERKLEILERMMQKYQPEGGYEGVSAEILKRTAVIEISIEEMTGKENLG